MTQALVWALWAILVWTRPEEMAERGPLSGAFVPLLITYVGWSTAAVASPLRIPRSYVGVLVGLTSSAMWFPGFLAVRACAGFRSGTWSSDVIAWTGIGVVLAFVFVVSRILVGMAIAWLYGPHRGRQRERALK